MVYFFVAAFGHVSFDGRKAGFILVVKNAEVEFCMLILNKNLE